MFDWYEIAGIVAGVVLVIGIGFVKAWAHIPREIGEALIALADYAEDPSEEKRQKALAEWGDVIALVRKALGR